MLVGALNDCAILIISQNIAPCSRPSFEPFRFAWVWRFAPLPFARMDRMRTDAKIEILSADVAAQAFIGALDQRWVRSGLEKNCSDIRSCVEHYWERRH